MHHRRVATPLHLRVAPALREDGGLLGKRRRPGLASDASCRPPCSSLPQHLRPRRRRRPPPRRLRPGTPPSSGCRASSRARSRSSAMCRQGWHARRRNRRRVGKSTSTAYNLLDTLCHERFVFHAEDGSYHLTTEAVGFVPAPGLSDLPSGLGGLLDELFARTRKRVYLAAAHSGQVVIPLARGRQGMPLPRGRGPRMGESAHARALGKVALSLLDEGGLERYISHGLRAFTPATIVSPDRLRAQLPRHPHGRR